MKWIVALVLTVFVTACNTTPKVEPAPAPIATPPPVTSSGNSIDYVGLQRSLGMEVPLNNLGYKEKAFNTCEVGYGYSTTHNCQQHYLVLINFHLQCRDSVGTVAEGVTNAELTAIANRPVRWNLKPNQGITNTNSDGFGQIMTISARSPRSERIKIGVGNDFLYMRANEITRVVTPRSWCH